MSLDERLQELSEDEHQEWEERSAIMEYDGGLDKQIAEFAAIKIILRSRNAKRNK